MTSPKVWFITGTSTGLGREVAECALSKGDNVFATLRKPSMLEDLTAKYPSSRLVTFLLDVTDTPSITTAFNEALSHFNRIDIVLNNAGYCMVSEAEGMSHKGAREMFDVLLWGAENVMREAIRCFRDVNRPMGGRLLNLSSRTAVIPQPGTVHYASAKAALECLSEGYISELDPEWGIKITLIQPGLFRTSVIQNVVAEPIHPAYASNASLPTRKYRALYPDIEKTHFDGDPAKFAEVVYKLSRLDEPPVRLPLHRVALESARQKGESLLEAVEKWSSWSDDVYFRN
ncbi:NAD(P)-binding protein [Suillus hirtellus]|nr:NAD(P)-binding protein [Suillus hirtellus]